MLMLTFNKHTVNPQGSLRAALTARYVFPSKVALEKREYAKAAEILPPEAEQYAYDGSIPAPERRITHGNTSKTPANRQHASIIFNAVSPVADHSQDQPTVNAEVDGGQLAPPVEIEDQVAHQDKAAHQQESSSSAPAASSVSPFYENRLILHKLLNKGEITPTDVARESQDFNIAVIKHDIAHDRMTSEQVFENYEQILEYAGRVRELAEQAKSARDLAAESSRLREKSREQHEHDLL